MMTALTTALTKVADSIRSKTGETAPMTIDSMSTKIDSIKVAGPIPQPNEVEFIDIDGEILYSYTIEEAHALTELPPLPTRDRLICTGWNYTLDEIKGINAPMNIGAIYNTDDGYTRFVVELTDLQASTVTLNLVISATADILWGDGEISLDIMPVLNDDEPKSVSHTYSELGTYEIAIRFKADVATSTDTFMLGSGTSNNSILGSLEYDKNRLKEVYMGSSHNFIINDYCFSTSFNLEIVSLSNSVSAIDTNAFANSPNIKCLNIPRTITAITTGMCNKTPVKKVSLPPTVVSIGANAFNASTNIDRVCCPNVTSFGGTNVFYGAVKLKSAYLPKLVTFTGSVFYGCSSLSEVQADAATTYGASLFMTCFSLESFKISDGATAIPGTMFSNCKSLMELTIPAGIKTIAASAFLQCTYLKHIYFYPTTPPTLANVNAFSGVPTTCVFHVPAISLEEYQTATNYTTLSTRMVGDL